MYIYVKGRVCGALVQFGCYQHRHEWMNVKTSIVCPVLIPILFVGAVDIPLELHMYSTTN